MQTTNSCHDLFSSMASLALLLLLKMHSLSVLNLQTGFLRYLHHIKVPWLINTEPQVDYEQSLLIDLILQRIQEYLINCKPLLYLYDLNDPTCKRNTIICYQINNKTQYLCFHDPNNILLRDHFLLLPIIKVLILVFEEQICQDLLLDP